MEREPHELLPAMPPMVARLAGETSTGKKSPLGFSQAFSPVEHDAGLDRDAPRLLVETDHPVEVPAGVDDHRFADRLSALRRAGAARQDRAPASRQIAIARAMSSALRGATIPIGSIW